MSKQDNVVAMLQNVSFDNVNDMRQKVQQAIAQCKAKQFSAIASFLVNKHKNLLDIDDHFIYGKKSVSIELIRDYVFNDYNTCAKCGKAIPKTQRFCSTKCAETSADVRDKIKQTWIKNTGYVCNFADPVKRKEYNEIAKQAHGDDYNNHSKAEATCLSKYGALCVWQTHIKHFENYNKNFVTKHFLCNGRFNVKAMARYFGISPAAVYMFKQRNGITELNINQTSISNTEICLQKFCKSLSDKVKFNKRGMLGDKRELDVVFPDNKLAIEFNGLFWHCTATLQKHGFDPINYHLNKTIDCENMGYNLLHVFEHEPLKKWKGVIKHFLHIEKVIPSDKTQIAIISENDAAVFVFEYGIAQHQSDLVNYGLCYQNEILLLVTCKIADTTANIVNMVYKTGWWVDNGLKAIVQTIKQNHNITTIKAITDRRYDCSQDWLANGFKIVEYTKPNKLLLDKKKRFCVIQQTENGSDTNDAIYDCGNIVYEYGGDTPE